MLYMSVFSVLAALSPISGSSASDLQNSWEWENPLPTLDYLWDMESIGSQGSMIAVGNHGTVIITQNSWVDYNWVQMPETVSGTGFRSVCFPSDRTGYISGCQGCILRSINGSGWEIIRLGDSQEILNDADFHDNSFGILVGATGSESMDPGGIILITRDGGASWVTDELQSFLRSVDLINSTRAVSVGEKGMILLTEDGGETWNRVNSPTGFTLNTVLFLDESVGLSAGFKGALLRTDDGGHSWNEVQTNATEDVTFYDLAWSEEDDVCVLVGNDGYSPLVMVSRDHGMTWELAEAPAPNFLLAVEEAENGFAASGCWGSLVTSDPSASCWTAPLPGFYSMINGFSPVSGDIGVCVGDEGLVARTEDRGESWEVIEPVPVTCQLNDVSFLNADQGIAVGDDGVVMQTSDGGQSWNSPTSHASCDLMAVAYVSGHSAFAAGEDGLLLHSENGGYSWNPIQFPTGDYDLLDVRFTDDSTGFICGEGDVFLRTVDGGANWESLPRTGEGFGTMSCLDFADGNTGYCAGWGSRVIRTTDAGETWSLVLKGSPFFLWRDVFAYDGRTALICGDMGTVMFTENSGRDWTDVSPSGVGSVLKELHYYPSCDRLLVMGGVGAVLSIEGLLGSSYLASPAGRNAPASPELLPGLDLAPVNPTDGCISVRIANTGTYCGDVSYRIFSIDGRMVARGVIEVEAGTVGTMELNDNGSILPSGLYAVLFSCNGRSCAGTFTVLER